jgi:ubiquinol-cytochrome c reductase iron-sulfur subunit
MSDSPVDSAKRTWIIASGCAGAVGAGFAAVPFVSSFQPSERARAAGASVEVDISALKPGEKLTVEWRGKPVWIIKRTPEQVAELPKNDPLLADPSSQRKPGELTPEYARNEHRSIKPEIMVAVGICTHLGCSPSDRFTRSPRCLTPGRAGSFVPATARRSTWLDVSTRTSRHPTTLRCRRTCTFPTRSC